MARCGQPAPARRHESRKTRLPVPKSPGRARCEPRTGQGLKEGGLRAGGKEEQALEKVFFLEV